VDAKDKADNSDREWWFQRAGKYVAILGAALWLCIYPVALIFAGIAFFLWVPQGTELLLIIMTENIAWSALVLFHVSLLALGFSGWYYSRVLLARRFSGHFANPLLQSDDPFARRVRKWLPRILGALVFVALAYRAFTISVVGGSVQSMLFALWGALYWLFVVYRRDLFSNGHSIGGMKLAKIFDRPDSAGELQQTLNRSTIAILLLTFMISYALFAGFVLSAVWLPRAIGAGAIVLLAFCSWIAFGSIVLVLLPKSYGLPSFALLPVVLAIAASNVDNHSIRLHTLQSATPSPRPAGVDASFMSWLQMNPEFAAARREGREKFPVFIATAEGGGLRAGYWTATVLGELEAATAGRFSHHLYAISGVSGGSLGATAFTAEIASGASCQSGLPSATRVKDCVQQFLRGDFLSPVLAYLLFPDLIQRFLPFIAINSFDRARALEHAWEDSWGASHPDATENLFAKPFERLAAAGLATRPVPVLYLNATSVETGRRAVVSFPRVRNDEFGLVRDVLEDAAKSHWMPVSTAVHLSARFSYVSPAGSIHRSDTRDGALWGRLVDGGYHENSGALTAIDVLSAIRRVQRTKEFKDIAGDVQIELHALMITNDPLSTRICEAAAAVSPSNWLSELLSPPLALLNARIAHGARSRRDLSDAAARQAGIDAAFDSDCAIDRARMRTLEFALPDDDKTPLGWYLSHTSAKRMNNVLCANENAAAIMTARTVLGVSGPYECSQR
jgi:Patatin-like phospholipase